MSKYNRTMHFPFSPEIHSDDKTLDQKDIENFIGKEIVITEKADGGNACLTNKQVYARTHSEPASHGSFSMLKALNDYFVSFGLLDGDMRIYGENMQGIHSIDYGFLKSPFYIFNIFYNNEWYSWDDVESVASFLNIPTVPVVFRGVFNSEKELRDFLDKEIDKPSLFNESAEREGFVVRKVEAFKNEDFSKSIAKYVRKGHVQTDEHWSNNWKQAQIDPEFFDKIFIS